MSKEWSGMSSQPDMTGTPEGQNAPAMADPMPDAPEAAPETQGVAPEAAPETQGVAPEAAPETQGAAPEAAPETQGAAPEAAPETQGAAPEAAPETQGAAPEATQDGAPDPIVENGRTMTHKYEVEIHEHEIAPKIEADTREELVAAGMMPGGKINIKGVSAKMLRRMKREYVDCPVLERDVQFLKCFVCSNFQSRVRGKVLCMGLPIKANVPSQG